MKLLGRVSFILAAMTLSVGVFAGTCEILYERTACPGKESISFKKCDGEATCSKFKEAANVAECRALANDACANDRVTITKSKVINATFDEKAITTESGKSDFCEEYPKRDQEFNKCS